MRPARAVGFDILLSEPDPLSAEALQKRLQADFDQALPLPLPPALRDNDALLAATATRIPLTLGAFLGADDLSLLPNHAQMASPFVLVGTGSPVHALAQIPTMNHGIFPIAPLLDAGAQGAFVNVLLDDDGVVRRVPMLYRREQGQAQQVLYPSFALRLLMQATAQQTVLLYFDEQGLHSLGLGAYRVPVSAQGVFRPWFRSAAPMPRISAVDVLQGRVPAHSVAGKIVMVGSSAAGIKDLRPTPLNPLTAGADIHATAVDNILRGHFLLRPPWESTAVLAVMLGLAVVLALAASLLPASIILPLVPVGCWGLWYVSCFWAARGVYVSVLLPLLALLTGALAVIAVRVALESRQKKFLRNAFSRYLAPEMVKKLLEDPQSVTLHGEERPLSVFFMDIRGFTTMSKRMSPRDVSQALNACFSPTTQSIREHSGTVDKFIGDACMAFWNAPLDVPEHEKKALAAALHILDSIADINDHRGGFHGERLSVGIGLHVGIAYVGNMGTEELFSYTCIGDTVNIASRVEGLCSRYGVPLLVTEAVRLACDEKSSTATETPVFWDFAGHTLAWLDKVPLKGHPVLFDIHTLATQWSMSAAEKDLYAAAVRARRAGRHDEALALYAGLVPAHEADAEKRACLSKLMELCAEAARKS